MANEIAIDIVWHIVRQKNKKVALNYVTFEIHYIFNFNLTIF